MDVAYAVVSTPPGTPVTVTLYSSDTAVPAKPLGSYTPVAGDRVIVVKADAGLVILGKVV